MKGTAAILSLVAAAVFSASAAYDGTFRVRAASYNIRCDVSETDSTNNWGNRKADLVNLVKSIDPDVIGFQEVDPSQMTDIKSLLPAYEIFGKHREANNTKRATPVAYKKSRFALLDGGTFWLSTTPNVQGSKGLPDGYTGTDPETCSWALLKDRTSGGVFCFFSTHLDWKQPECRKRQMAIAVAQAVKFIEKAVPTFIVGDMNATETEASIRVAAAVMQDSLLVSKTAPTGSWRTFNGWTWKSGEASNADALANYTAAERTANESALGGKRIDFIFSSFGTEVEAFATRNDTRPGKNYYPSDHYPIVADLRMPCDNDLYSGKVRVEIDKTIPYVGYGRYVLTKGANLPNDANLEFVLPDWVQRAAVEDGEIVIYTKPKPLSIRVR